MAWQYVGGTSGVGTSTGYTVSLTGLTGGIASAPAEGDLVVVFSGFGNTASSAPNVTGNNSGAYLAATAAQHVNDTWDTEFRSFYEVMGATPDTSLTITRVTNAAYGGATTVQVWRGVDQASPFIGAATPASGGNGAALNPPAYDPAVSGALVIAGGAGTMPAAGTAGYTAITGLSNIVTRYGDGSTADASVIMGSVAYAGASIDPPVATGGTQNNTSSSWAGVTMAFRAAPEPITGDLLVQEGASDAFTGTGSVEATEITGALAAVESGSDVLAGTGGVAVFGQFTAVEAGSDALTAASTAVVAAALAPQEAGADAFTGSAAMVVAGSLTAQDGQDTASGLGMVAITGSATLSESGTDAFTGSGSTLGTPVEGGLAAQESGADALTAFVAVGISGSVAAQDGPDGFAGTAAVVVTGVAFLAEQGIDAFAGVGSLIVSGVMAAQEVAADALTAVGAVGVTGSMSVFDAGSDVLTGSGAVWVAGSAAVQEAGGDTFTGTGGELVLLPIVGLMAAAEDGVDAFVAAASVQIDAFLDAQELGGDVGAGLALTLAPLQALPPGSGYNRPTKGCSRPAMAALVRPETVNAARPHMTNTTR